MRTIKAVSGGCPASLDACLCNLPKGHNGPHVCVCEGSWNADGSIVSLPQTGDPFLDSVGDVMTSLFGAEPDEEG